MEKILIKKYLHEIRWSLKKQIRQKYNTYENNPINLEIILVWTSFFKFNVLLEEENEDDFFYSPYFVKKWIDEKDWSNFFIINNSN